PCGKRNGRSLKGIARGEVGVVIVGVKRGGRDLYGCAEGKALTAFCIVRIELEWSRKDAGGQKVLLLAVVRTAVKPGRVVFDLDPRLLGEVVLGVRIPGYGTAQLIRLLGRNRGTEAGSDVELAEA